MLRLLILVVIFIELNRIILKLELLTLNYRNFRLKLDQLSRRVRLSGFTLKNARGKNSNTIIVQNLSKEILIKDFNLVFHLIS
jgi:hypothetical protein